MYHVKVGLMCTHSLALIAPVVIPFNVEFADSQCKYGTFMLEDMLNKVWLIWAFICICIIPLGVVVYLNASIIYFLRKHRVHSILGKSSPSSRVTRQLAWTTLTICVICVCRVGFEVLYFTMFSHQLPHFINYPAIGITGCLLPIFKSLLHPIIFAAFLPVYRNRLISLACRWRRRTNTG